MNTIIAIVLTGAGILMVLLFMRCIDLQMKLDDVKDERDEYKKKAKRWETHFDDLKRERKP